MMELKLNSRRRRMEMKVDVVVAKEWKCNELAVVWCSIASK